MNTKIAFPQKSGLTLGFVAAPLILGGGLMACTSQTETPTNAPAPVVDAVPGVPAVLNPGPTERLAVSYTATGVQIYACKAAANGAPAWTFVAPEAELFDARGTKVVDHGAGPSWQHRDGSKVIGSVTQRADAPEAGAIPWLLLSAKSVGGPGALADVTSIQRINTKGGVAPAQGCSDTKDMGKQARVPYSALYVFYVTH